MVDRKRLALHSTPYSFSACLRLTIQIFWKRNSRLSIFRSLPFAFCLLPFAHHRLASRSHLPLFSLLHSKYIFLGTPLLGGNSTCISFGKWMDPSKFECNPHGA